jgi:cobaltochelatase CobT
MNERVFVLRQSIVKLTQMLAGKGVQVTQQGIRAYVQSDGSGRPVRVNLPYMPDNATEELIGAIQGFLDHEVAHILFTDFSIMPKCTDESVAEMLNLVEDTRIEREMAKRFQGSAHNLEVTGKFFLDKYTTPKITQAIAGGDDNLLLGVLTVPLVRAMAGQKVFQDFMASHMGTVKPIHDKIKDLAPKIAACETTQDACDLAKEMVKRLRGDVEEEPSSASGKKPTKAKGKGGGKAGKGTGPKEKGGAKPEEEKEDEDGGEDEEEKEDKDGDEDEADTAVGADGDEDDDSGDLKSAGGSDDDEGEDVPDEADSGSSKGSEKMDVGGRDAATWKAIDKEIKNDYDSTISREITDTSAACAADADYLVFTTDKDVIEPLHVSSKYEPKMLIDLQDKVDHMVGPMQKDLERAISARSLSVWSTGHRTGRLHPANLSRLAIKTPSGYDDRVFRKKHEQSSKDVAVELVVDMSGSMGGSKIHTATQAAYALASTMERIGIKSEVICFTTGPMCAPAPDLNAEIAKIGRAFNRMESLYMPILKGFDERLSTEVKKRFGWLPNSGHMQSNVDGECVMVAGRRLLQRRETGKIMIVLSDGYPAAAGASAGLKAHLKKVVRDLTKAGVNMIGIGIESAAVQDFYPKNMVLNNVEELPGAVMKTLRGLIVQGSHVGKV